LQGTNNTQRAALSDAIVQPAFVKGARRVTRRAQRADIAIQNNQDVRNRRLHNATTGQHAPVKRPDEQEFPKGEWWGEGEVVGEMFQISQRSLA
jgi:hypothetical protein